VKESQDTLTERVHSHQKNQRGDLSHRKKVKKGEGWEKKKRLFWARKKK